jgi:hypothetical protein
VHAVFTLPRELGPLVLQNKKVLFNLLFHASAETLLEVARDPRHLGAEIGFFSVLHSWDQRLLFHPHLHCILAAGGLAPDHASWISSSRRFFLPIGVLSRVFRGKFVAGLKSAFHAGDLQFHGSLRHMAEPPAFRAWLRTLFRHDWVVYANAPSEDHNTPCAISAPTPIESPSPTTDSSPSKTATSPSAGATPLTATGKDS